MFLTTSLNLISGMVIGAATVLAMKKMCKQRCNRSKIPMPTETTQDQM